MSRTRSCVFKLRNTDNPSWTQPVVTPAYWQSDKKSGHNRETKKTLQLFSLQKVILPEDHSKLKDWTAAAALTHSHPLPHLPAKFISDKVH